MSIVFKIPRSRGGDRGRSNVTAFRHAMVASVLKFLDHADLALILILLVVVIIFGSSSSSTSTSTSSCCSGSARCSRDGADVFLPQSIPNSSECFNETVIIICSGSLSLVPQHMHTYVAALQHSIRYWQQVGDAPTIFQLQVVFRRVEFRSRQQARTRHRIFGGRLYDGYGRRCLLQRRSKQRLQCLISTPLRGGQHSIQYDGIDR
mmetsp:Transcript_15771/g.26488  ORF Transcript_15771/g.26488 Transcript_15771/m.26488 type:complete len:206 (+) Transcript_15771:1030-1647(+)